MLCQSETCQSFMLVNCSNLYNFEFCKAVHLEAFDFDIYSDGNFFIA